MRLTGDRWCGRREGGKSSPSLICSCIDHACGPATDQGYSAGHVGTSVASSGGVDARDAWDCSSDFVGRHQCKPLSVAVELPASMFAHRNVSIQSAMFSNWLSIRLCGKPCIRVGACRSGVFAVVRWAALLPRPQWKGRRRVSR